MYKYSKYNIVNKLENGNYFLYNSVSKASVEMDEKTYAIIQSNLFNFNQEDFKFLLENNFIVDKNKKETEEIKYLFNAQYFSSDPLNIVLVPTLECNFDCPYCFEKVTAAYSNKKYYDDLMKYALKNFNKHSVVQLSLFGGEPLIMEKETLEFLKKIKEDSLAKNYELKTNITTNGSLLTEYNITKLLEYGLFSLQITLDGNKKTHDLTRKFKNGSPSFELLLSKIKLVLKLTKNKPDFIFNLRINLKNNSKSDLKDILNNFSDEEKKRIRLLIRVIYDTDKYKGENSNSLGNLKKFYDVAVDEKTNIVKNSYFYQTCEACGDSKFFYLMPDMTMWKCINDLNFKKACIGKIDENGDAKINYQNVLDWYNAANCFNDKKCLKCSKLPDCYGGCILYKIKNRTRNCKTFDMACLPYRY